ncbi:hypothetical protein [Halodesulfovibrio spirochaetisodalis]|uniref:Uncharacterized protein n=1 Tax=Halodesulfovibrio spirochaetisodalis TaxID=1560234 RepID=A0A1B7XL63_9BACT|nr:hypothetical protein [Halodesulfovibrio spirochaetisodalis]OBQ56244.1 hypothetical protein SP90_02710 [Halodesulfovibrio spirochaetisodalis]
MFSWLASAFRRLTDSIRYKEKVSPEAIRVLAAELRELAQVAEMFATDEVTPIDRIKRIQSETGQLIELTGRAEFRRLSVQRRLELHDSLVDSKRHLLNTMQATPVPTDVIQ